MENDDSSDPIVDIARASLDGQVMLSRALADAAHYPAIDLMGSVSRVMPALVDSISLKAANRFRRLWTLYQQNAELIQVGAYEQGANLELDEAVAKRSYMENFLRQDMNLSVDYQSSVASIKELMSV
jgi:flagellum-specific ATP synthase